MSDNNVMTDDDVLSFTQGKRRDLVLAISSDGPPVTKDDRITLLSALDGMDRQALGNKRLVSDEKTGNANLLVARALAKIASCVGGTDPFQADSAGTIPALELGLLGSHDVLPGELQTTSGDMDYATFSKVRGLQS